ncbi:MAG: DHCW motif cupin fold protein [Bacteroidetes bacterium]|nr:DHCW motif cupin fold protein [Bacteroidota bacterium]
MELTHIPFQTIDWDSVPPEEHPGETGSSTWRMVKEGNVRVRIVDYSAGFLADHWCQKGHVVHVLEGEFVSELEDGRSCTLTKGMTYIVADDKEAHRSRSKNGVRLLIVD